ncbi:MAG: hypothetical protein ACRDL2_02445, partial [Gaiellaceae bacterium]
PSDTAAYSTQGVEVRGRIRMRMLVALVAALFTAGALLLASVGASADHGDHHGSNSGKVARTGDDDGNGDDREGAILSSTLAPSQPTDPAIDGVSPGGVPWALKRGSVQLQANGGIRVSIRGLVIPIAHGTFPAGTALPVTTVSASLYCAPGAAAATTMTVPLTSTGNASIVDTMSLPATCLAPVVLVHPNGGDTAYIAATGWRS